ncbi:RNA ligase family protein [Nocardia colli]|uniref:RNA ligase family protein n=1 Tax=Nocardia colli TaxID=2545717 RepID=UPI0035E0408A
MNFDAPKNPNYAATVTAVKAIKPLPGRDNIVSVPLFGYDVIVPKTWQPGELGVFIPAEAQLSHDYATANNLYRHADLNENPDVTGYLEDNRRIKAIRLGGHASNALFMPLVSLEFAGIDVNELREGDTFDVLNGVEIVRKYERPRKTGGASAGGNQTPKSTRIDKVHFPEHLDTSNFFRMSNTIEPSDFLWLTQKLHGTSVRFGRTIVQRKLTLRERIALRFGVTVQTTEYANVYGSRHVIKDASNPDQAHYYTTDIWTLAGRKYDDVIPTGYVVYGELIGWTPDGKPLQTGYTYGVPPGRSDLYVYRVATINPHGFMTDLSWPQVEEFCANHGLVTVPLLWAGYSEDFDPDAWMNKRYADEGYRAVPLEPGDTVDEGVIVRIDGLKPRIYKAKASRFLEHETKSLDDENAIDMEELGSITEPAALTALDTAEVRAATGELVRTVP